MIFAGIDVNIITHEKLLAACEGGDLAPFGLWTFGMCHAQLHETNGRLARAVVLSALGGRRNVMLAKKLVAAGLWLENDDGSWQVWNYGKKNQSAEEIRKRKDNAAAKMRDWRDRRNGIVTRNVTALLPGNEPVRYERSLQPEPELQPEPDQITAPQGAAPAPKTGVRSRGTRLPEGWTPSAEAQTWAKAQGVADPLGPILDDFRDYWGALPGARGVKLDWDATFRSRVRQVATRAPTGRGQAAPRQQLGSAASAKWMNPTENFDFAAGDK